jgi:hypothetical protein
MRKLSRPSAQAPDLKHETHMQRPESPLPSLQYLPRHREFRLAVHLDASSKGSVQGVRESELGRMQAALAAPKLNRLPLYTTHTLVSSEINKSGSLLSADRRAQRRCQVSGIRCRPPEKELKGKV